MPGEHEYDVLLVPQPEEGLTVFVPELPDVVTEGETREQALAMAVEAIEAHLAVIQAQGWQAPGAIHQRVIVRPV
jgi:antitoxin HicB